MTKNQAVLSQLFITLINTPGCTPRELLLAKKAGRPRQARISHMWTRPPASNQKAQGLRAHELLLRYLGVTPLNARGCWLLSALSLTAVWGEIEARVLGKSSPSYQATIHLNIQLLLKLPPAILGSS